VNSKSKKIVKSGKRSEHHVKQHRERYYKQFDFFFTRTCFRYMNEYYKDKYSDFMTFREDKKSNKCLSQVSKVEMEDNLRQFIIHLFGADVFTTKAFTANQK